VPDRGEVADRDAGVIHLQLGRGYFNPGGISDRLVGAKSRAGARRDTFVERVGFTSHFDPSDLLGERGAFRILTSTRFLFDVEYR
jgi:hypothetical protein